MKRILFSLFLVLIAVSAMAVPAKRGQFRTLTLSDGSTVRAQLVGDEYGHYWKADNGRSYICKNANEIYEPVDVQSLMEKSQVRRQLNNQRRAMRQSPSKVGEVNGGITGSKKGIIILVNFQDRKFQNTDNANTLFNNIANKEGYDEGNFKGSMHDYFYDQSLGQFDLTFDVVGPYTLGHDYSFYGQNYGGSDRYPATMVIEAITAADKDVNFADYDWDGDKEVDQVYVVYAGKGEADGGTSDTIWPHEWTLEYAQNYNDGSGPQTLDGVKINTYACGAELNGSGETCGIGTMCHEFSHCLGYPDFYDTSNGSGVGMFCWDLMDYGSYNGGGYQPAGYTSYERREAGWAEPTELTTTRVVENMKPLQENAESYIIYNKANKNEYFLFENRKQVGWDASLPGSGLLIVHVEYNASAWENNSVNTTASRQRMTWIPADNNYTYNYDDNGYALGQASDLYPYNTKNSFSKSSTPAAKFYNKNSDGTYYMDSSINNITRNSDGTITFNFVGLSNVETPTFSPKAGLYTEAQQVTISCSTSGATIYYTIDGSTPTTTSTPYTGPISVEATTTINAIAVKSGEQSEMATAKYVIRTGGASTTNKFKRVTSTNEMVSGLRYIIACGSKKTAAGALNNQILSSVSVDLSDDIITITDDVNVFTLDGSGTSYSFMNDEGQYLYATTTKNLAFSNSEKTWTLANGTSGVTMTYGSYGTMLYNSTAPRFTTYTSNPTTSMIQANLYVEYDNGTVEKKDVTMNFNPNEVSATLGESFTAPTLTTTPAGLAVTYTSGNTSVATVTSDGIVTLVGEGTTTITASFAGNDEYNSGEASYTLTVNKKSGETSGTGRYKLVTKADELEAGKNYLIVSVYNDDYVAWNGFDTNKGITGSVTPSDNIIDLNNNSNEAVPVVLGDAGSSTWSVYDTDSKVYIGAGSGTTGSRKAYLYSSSDISSDYYRWTVNVTSSGVATVSNSGKNGYKLLYNNSSDMFRVYTSGQQDVYIYKEIEEVVEEPVKIKVTSAGWATFCWGEPMNFTDTDMSAYTMTGIRFDENNNLKSVLITRLYEVPSYTGILIKAAEGEYDVPEDQSINPSELAESPVFGLIGVNEATHIDPTTIDGYTNLVLSNKNGVGFYPLSKGTTMKAHSAYMMILSEILNSSSSGNINISVIEEDTDSISQINYSTINDGAWYTLSGVRLSKPTAPGLYIHNGHKVVIK